MSGQGPALLPAVAAEPFLPEESINRISGQLSRQPSASSSTFRKKGGFREGVGLQSVARRTLGIILLLLTVFLWTSSNFLASSIFADNTYSKPYFVTYFNTSFFAISLLPIFIKIAYQNGYHKLGISALKVWRGRRDTYRALQEGRSDDDGDDTRDRSTSSGTRLLEDHEAVILPTSMEVDGLDEPEGMLNVRETAKLSLEFAIIWFAANYFVAACLTYTTVASSTILTSTSSIFTLLFGAMVRVEIFTVKKLFGVLACFAGVVLISMVDLSGESDENRGSFPHKSQKQIAIGDSMAIISAVMYGIYTIVMKKSVKNEDRVNMPLFFGLVGLFNLIILWPGFLILHYTGLETFGFPPSRRVWTILLFNAASSFLSDYCWAYAMLLTTPLVVTVGLSLTIPLTLIGQMVLSAQYSSGWYWAGACVVVLSFLFINHESHEPDMGNSEIDT